MKNIRDLVSNIQKPIGSATTHFKQQCNATVPDSAKEFIDELFDELKATYPAYDLALKTPDEEKMAKKVWTKAFIENGIIDRSQVKYGLKKARADKSKYLPSVGQFISWCTPLPEDFGMPSVDSAFNMVIRRTIQPDTHPIVITVARHTKLERQTLDLDDYKKVFTREYEIQMRRVMSGEQIGEVAKGIERKKEKPKLVLTPTGWKEIQ